MQYAKRLFAILIVVVILFVCTAPCFSAGVATLTAAEEMMAMWSLYMESVGITPIYTTNGIKSTTTNPFNRQVAIDNMTSLYGQYQIYANMTETIQETVDYLKTYTSIAVSNQQTAAFEYAAGVTDFWNKFTTWVLEDVVGVTKDAVTGLFDSSKQWFHNTLIYIQTSDELSYGNNVMALNVGQVISHGGNRDWSVSSSGTVFLATSTNYIKLYALSQTSQTAHILRDGSNYAMLFITTPVTINGDTWYYAETSYGYQNTLLPVVSYFPPSASDVLTRTDAEGNRIQLGPKDIYNDGVLGIPDVDAQDYAPDAITGVTTKEAVGGIAPSLNDVLVDTLDKVLGNVQVLADNIVQPSLVTTPYLPFSGIPSFSFNFSGIWHYVVEWVGSLRSGYSFITTLWQNIPYAMVIPIYAAAVIVIVSSVFKRFV